jgi:Mlc titration factor MtfA (ptsG expression regulator)
MYKNLLSETELFSIIPIYSRSIKEWKNKYEKELEKYISEKKDLYESQGIQFDKKLQCTLEIRFNERIVPWRYNDIIGFLELRLYKDELQLHFYKRENKKYIYDYCFESVIQNFLQNDIEKQHSLVFEAIKELQKKYLKFKKKHFDTEMFLTTLKHLR